MSCCRSIRPSAPGLVGPVVLIALVGVLVGALVVGTPSPAAASPRGQTATPANDSAHPWPTDGCSMVPDVGWWVHLGIPARFDFHHACVHHDGCYRRHWSTRETCDGWFLDHLWASCRWQHPFNLLTRATCRDLARRYHLGVRLLGASAYRNGSPVIPLRAG